MKEIKHSNEKAFFKVIIPNYNSEEFIAKCLDSILSQSFEDYRIIVIDDCSTDNSMKIVKEYAKKYPEKIEYLFLDKKRWNGGTRNIGIMWPIKSKYTLFIDNDDYFDDSECFQTIYDLIKNNNYPDCVSLSYNWVGDEKRNVILSHRNNIENLVKDCNVACWTKCIKSDLMVLFPENTLKEDVVQHIAQCDVIETVVSCNKPIVNWNRNNPNSASTNGKLQNCKWESSVYRYCADLMDLQVNKPYCEEERLRRIKEIKDCIREELL